MNNRTWHIAKTFWMRPLMWCIATISAIILFASVRSIPQNHSIMLAPAYPDYGKVNWSDHELNSFEQIESILESQTSDDTVTHLDFSRIGGPLLESTQGVLRSGGSPNSVRNALTMAELRQALTLLPNLRSIVLTDESLEALDGGQLAAMTELRHVSVVGHTLTEQELRSLIQIRQLRELELQVMHLIPTLESLATLSELRSLVLRHGGYQMTDSPIASTFRPAVLRSIAQLESLEELALAPQYLPGIAYFAGSTEADPACDSVLKQNVIEAFRDQGHLRKLWLGYASELQQRADLSQVCQALPQTQVHASQFDRKPAMRAWSAFLTLFMLQFGVLLHGTALYSTPMSVVIPGYCKHHSPVLRSVLLCLALIATGLMYEFRITLASAIVIACLSTTLTAATHHYILQIEGVTRPDRSGLRLLHFLPCGFLLCSSPIWMTESRTVGPALDWFLTAGPSWVTLPVATGLVALCWVFWRRFEQLHRDWQEHGIAPAMSLIEMAEQLQQIQFTTNGVGGKLRRRVPAWYRRLERISQSVDPYSVWSDAERWALGAPLSLFLRIYLAVCLFAVLAAYLLPGTLTRFTLGYGTFMAMLLATAWTGNLVMARASVLGYESLFPIAKQRRMQSVFVAIATRLASRYSVVLLGSILFRMFYIDTPTLLGILHSCFVTIAAVGFSTGVIILAPAIKPRWVTMVVLTVVIILQTMPLTISYVGFRSGKMEFDTFVATNVGSTWVLFLWSLVAIGTLMLGAIRWRRIEWGCDA